MFSMHFLQNEADPELVSEASKLGWVDKDNWKGDESKWIDAKTFMEKREQLTPVLARENKRLDEELKTARQQIKQLQEDGKQFQELIRRQAERDKAELTERYERALKDKANAVKEGDDAAFLAAENEQKKLEEEARALDEQAKKKQADANAPHPDFEPWLVANPWYRDDPELNFAANYTFNAMVQSGTSLRGKALFDAVKKKVMKMHPDKFEDADNERGNTVEGEDTEPVNSRLRKLGGKTYADLPADAKATCDRYIRNGWIAKGQKEADFRAAFAKEYFATN